MGPCYSIDAVESSIIFTDDHLGRPLMQLSFIYFSLNVKFENICPQLCTYAWSVYVECHLLWVVFHVCCPVFPLLPGGYLCEEVTCAPFKSFLSQGLLG